MERGEKCNIKFQPPPPRGNPLRVSLLRAASLLLYKTILPSSTTGPDSCLHPAHQSPRRCVCRGPGSSGGSLGLAAPTPGASHMRRRRGPSSSSSLAGFSPSLPSPRREAAATELFSSAERSPGLLVAPRDRGEGCEHGRGSGAGGGIRGGRSEGCV